MKKEKIKLGDRMVGKGEPVFIICEGGVTNYGEIDIAKRQIDAAYNARADIVKFQATITENLVSKKVAKRMQTKMGYDWFARMKYKEFTFDEFRELARYVGTGGWPFFATAHDEEALDFLDKELNQPYFKVGSGESHNYEFLKNIARRGKPVMISFGLQTDKEVMAAIKALEDGGAKDNIIVVHTTTLYPTPYEVAALPRMAHLRELTGYPVGISDHTVGWHVVLGAVALGACVVEKHITFGKDDSRSLDNAGALLPWEFSQMVSQIRDIEKAQQDVPEKERQKLLKIGRDWAGQSLIAKRDIKPGAILTSNMITFKRPAKGGIGAQHLDTVLGKKVKTKIEADEQILKKHLR